MVWEAATLYSKYYRGPFKGLKQEISELIAYIQTKEKKEPTRVYTWETNCPKCWEREGGPTTVIFARVLRNGESEGIGEKDGSDEREPHCVLWAVLW